MSPFNAPFAFSNIGMSGSAFEGHQWERKHTPRLLKLFTELRNESVVGLVLNEVGNFRDWLSDGSTEKLEDVFWARPL